MRTRLGKVQMRDFRFRKTNWLKSVGLAALLAVLSPAHAAEKTTYFHFDALGSPVAATDQAGNVVWKEEYRPYGARIKQEPAAASNTRWYTGHPQDDDTGLTYMGARYYDPIVGRFMATDPKGFTADNIHSFNRYAYANNNPYKFVDPDGEFAVLPWILWAVATGLFVDSVVNPPAAEFDAFGDAPIGDVITAPGPLGLFRGGARAARTAKELADRGAKGAPTPRTNKLAPNPKAEGPHTQFKTDPQTGKVTGYTEFDAAGNPVKRFRGQGKTHGGTEPPFILEPKLGKGPGSPPKVPRQPRPDELPRGY